jgi:predicted metalloendopeptidase
MKMRYTLPLLLCGWILQGCETAPSGAPAPTPARDEGVQALTSGVLLDRFDRTVRPQDDLYRHVNGRWLDSTPIPPDRSNYGVFTMLQDAAEADVHELLKESASNPQRVPGSDEQKAGDFFASFMDVERIEQQGLAPLQNEFARIEKLHTPQDLSRYIGYLQRIGIAQPFAYAVGIDEKNSTRYASYLFQNGLSLPDRDYYLSEDARMHAVRQKYREYIEQMLAAAGVRDAAENAEHILALETRLARASWTRVQSRDVQKTYNRHTLQQAAALAPGIDWRAFLEGAGIPKIDALVIAQPTYIAQLGQALNTVPIEHWREYFRFKLLDGFAPLLPQRFVELSFELHERTVSGVDELQPRWRRGVRVVEGSIGELVGRMYVERHFSPEAKRRVEALVANLLKAFEQSIDELEWMSPATKQRAHAKLANFTTKIGYPEKWRDWSKLEVRADDLIGNVMRASMVALDRDIAKLPGPIDRTEWFMTPQTVNAYYHPPANEIVFPAAILQPPFFDVRADDAVNYGAIGAVIGHEISHGFDDQGRRYDAQGNLTDWWTPEDNAEFQRRARALVEQYSRYSPIEGMHVNGELTLGENIADLAGVTMAYRAYKLSLGGKPAPVIDGFSGDQRFFIGWAHSWARKYRDDEMRKRLLTDPHSPGEYRANGVVRNLPPFYEAFGVKPGDKMYLPPEKRVSIW